MEQLLFADPASGIRFRREADRPFFAKQDRVLIGQNKCVDPRNVGDHIAVGGYTAPASVLSMLTSERVIDEIKASGLRERGGVVYPTGKKWEQCRRAPAFAPLILGAPGGILSPGRTGPFRAPLQRRLDSPAGR